MQPPAQSGKILRFGAFEVDVSSGEVRKSGMRVTLQGQPLQILLLLLESPGQVVRRESIRAHLWAADAVVELEHSLNPAIIRRSVGRAETTALIPASARPCRAE